MYIFIYRPSKKNFMGPPLTISVVEDPNSTWRSCMGQEGKKKNKKQKTSCTWRETDQFQMSNTTSTCSKVNDSLSIKAPLHYSRYYQSSNDNSNHKENIEISPSLISQESKHQSYLPQLRSLYTSVFSFLPFYLTIKLPH